MQSIFIAIEGMDGAGKTSCVKAFVDSLTLEEREKIVFTRQPGGTALGKEIRNLILHDLAKDADALTMMHLFFADRTDHMRVIRNDIQSGKHVITDRFAGSTFAYQIHGQENHDLRDLFDVLYGRVIQDCEPVYIYLDLPAEVSRGRREKAQNQTHTHFDLKPVDFYDRVRAGYLEFMQQVNGHVINADRPFEEVSREFTGALRQKLGLR